MILGASPLGSPPEGTSPDVIVSLTGVQARVSTSSYSNFATPGFVAYGYADLRSPDNFTRYVNSGYITGNTSYESGAYYHTDPGYVDEGYDYKVGIVPSIDYNLTLALTGVQSVGNVGRVATGELGSVQAVGNVGNITATQAVSKSVTGNTSTVSPGTVLFSVSYSLVGNQVILNPGNLSITQQLSRALTGVSGTGFVGNIGSLKSYDLTSAPIIVSPGSIGTSQNITRSISGNSTTVQLGNIGATQAIFANIAISGVSASGVISATQDYNHIYTYPTIVDLSYGSMAEFMGVVVLEDEEKQGSELVYG